MRFFWGAGAASAGVIVFSSSPIAGTLTYQDCVQECRDNLPSGKTLKTCIIERRCDALPKPRWTYGDCINACKARVSATGLTLQNCVVRFVCSQYPRDE
jgi:hypothetical protein